MCTLNEALVVLEATSRTFYIPISLLPGELQKAVASAYLCMRAIDEIEDHEQLARDQKTALLRAIGFAVQSATHEADPAHFNEALAGYEAVLPEVSQRLGEWLLLAPESIAPRVWDATSNMAGRMAFWAESDWRIQSEADLNRYTYNVAGAVGLLLSDLWAWFDGTQTNRHLAVGYGRGLQAVNILRNRGEDAARGVNFFPLGWDWPQMFTFADANLTLADDYLASLNDGPALAFSRIPLVLAKATLAALREGRDKLSRREVVDLVAPLSGA